jgi:orotate phosphoribosyltransferase
VSDVAQLARRINAVARLSGSFRLRSGQLADTHFDKYQFEAPPALLRAIGEHLATMVPSGTEILVGLEMGGIPVVMILSQVTGLPAAFLCKAAKPYGTCRAAEGPSLRGKQAVLVEDVVSTAGALFDGLDLWANTGAVVGDALLRDRSGRWRHRRACRPRGEVACAPDHATARCG